MTPSASSIETWLRCQRFWGRERIDGVRAPRGAKAELGSRCHEITEAYLRDGTAPNRAETLVIEQHGSPKTYYPGRIALNILHHLPPAGSVPRVEEQLDFRYRGIEFNGYIDWQTTDEVPGFENVIGDHKFTSSLDYAKSETDLLKDVQAVMYRTARWLESDCKTATLQWTYGSFDARASRAVRLPVVRELASMDALIPTVEQMLKAKETVTDALTLPKTGLQYRDAKTGSNACNMFGGCPHRQWCGVTGLERTKGLMASAALEKLRAQRAAAQAAANGNATAPAAAPATSPALVAGAVNPPGEACDPPASLVEKDDESTGSAIMGASSETPAESSSRVLGVSVGEAPTAALKKPRGRPAGSKNAPKHEPADIAQAKAAIDSLSTPVSTAVDTASKSSPVDTGAAKIHTLYVNCRPVKGSSPTQQLVDASVVIAAANAAICDEFKIDHYSFLDYGKARGALSHAVAVLVDSDAGSVDMTVDTTTQEARDCLQVLIERAACVVRGAA